ncbi:MBL fold metallo-hydrolase [Clostridium sporogenes]|uniref:MBL fold metallo-hydrolase n=1 Tax=Clostridium sporogenes TaxID=1509 RepID=A0A7X5SZC1_CLOSG|nr:MBL fold metallo-hydrolase [Clostridium sporogenes]AJD30978.1 beta-lactamase superfamily domain protein [Clostridium botulinum Prevot_594]AVP60802.1 MBL fold metallo-hydrolase [Clostridium botulinum]KRU44689.1 beta-lactamase [Clostridium sporogenes]MBY7014766.1 MBL fold metallo-hydrolase [Clostridium sporogenes]MBY7064681.1 MBL fold metallo-hydrolase [Clostridium sporogenes]
MKIKWLGHSCFILESNSKTTIITDPYEPSIGIHRINYASDICTISHNHFDHNFKDDLNKNCIILDIPIQYEHKDLKIKGFKSYHDKLNGLKRGNNIIFKFNIDGFNICHLGDLGHLLSKDFIYSLGSIDVLLIPIGGNYTLNGKEAAKLCKNINSHIIIPMHFGLDNIKIKLDGLEDFLVHMDKNLEIGSNIITLENNIKNYNNMVYILKT